MQVSCSTIGFGALPIEDALGRIAAIGFTEVEIGVLGDFCPHLDPLAPIAETVARSTALFDRCGLRPVALNSAPRIYGDDPADPDQLLRVADRLLELAAGLRCELILDVGEREDTDAGLRRAAAVAGEAFRRGRDRYGVTVSVEAPHRGMNAQTVPEALRLLEIAGEDALGITYDTSHATCGGVPAAEGLRLIGDRITRIQARDHRGGDVHHTPGDGEYDWPALARFLAANPRPVCLELEFDGRLTADQVAAESGRGREFLHRLVPSP
ncbi:sugar phosphate isomerase/epimerase [Micromonospora rifamycinica]|uniref:sugar phosphate isomerase/epimerase family protein n=1 Tax=Micromonospora rifamycinica TaxID=291594 RepID=UPI00341BB550